MPASYFTVSGGGRPNNYTIMLAHRRYTVYCTLTMTQIDYLSLYDSAKSELARLQNERTELEKQITALTKTISAIAPLVGAGAPEAAPVGLTDAIRSILARAEGPLSASEI